MEALYDAIWNKYNGDDTLKAALVGKLYDTKRPPNPSYPYAIFQHVSQFPDHTFDSVFEVATIQFNIFDNSDLNDTVNDAYSKLIALYDFCTLSISGYIHVRMIRRTSRLSKPEVNGDSDIWQYWIDYEIMCYKAR